MNKQLNTLQLIATVFGFLGAMRLVVFMPFVLSAWAGIYDLNESQMGLIASVEFGVASTVILFSGLWLKYIKAIYVYTIAFIAFLLIDFLSFHMSSFEALMGLRIISGILTGLFAGIVTVHLSQASHPGQAFGLTISAQWILPGIALYFIPALVDAFGNIAVFYVMAVMIMGGVLTLPFVSRAPLVNDDARGKSAEAGLPLYLPIITLFVIFAVYAVVGGYWAFAERIAAIRTLEPAEAGSALGIASFAAGGVALMVALFERFVGRVRTIVSFMTIMIAGLLWMLVQDGYSPFLAGTVGVAVVWGIVPPVLFSILVDSTDRAGFVAVNPGVQGYGITLGPLIVGGLLEAGTPGLAVEVLIGLTVMQIFILIGLAGKIGGKF